MADQVGRLDIGDPVESTCPSCGDDVVQTEERRADGMPAFRCTCGFAWLEGQREYVRVDEKKRT